MMLTKLMTTKWKIEKETLFNMGPEKRRPDDTHDKWLKIFAQMNFLNACRI